MVCYYEVLNSYQEQIEQTLWIFFARIITVCKENETVSHIQRICKAISLKTNIYFNTFSMFFSSIIFRTDSGHFLFMAVLVHGVKNLGILCYDRVNIPPALAPFQKFNTIALLIIVRTGRLLN